jgi:hypothetical protein
MTGEKQRKYVVTMEYYNKMIVFSIPQDYVILGSIILLLIIMVKFLNMMANRAQEEKTAGYKPVDVSTIKPLKVKEETIFLEEKINQFLNNEKRITLTEWRKVQAQAKGFKILVEQRGRAILDCHAFIVELERFLYIKFREKIFDDKEYIKLLKSIKGTNKIKK